MMMICPDKDNCQWDADKCCGHAVPHELDHVCSMNTLCRPCIEIVEENSVDGLLTELEREQVLVDVGSDNCDEVIDIALITAQQRKTAQAILAAIQDAIYLTNSDFHDLYPDFNKHLTSYIDNVIDYLKTKYLEEK